MTINFKLREKAFTLIELLVVIAIIGLLASVVLASLNTAREKANRARFVSDMRSVMNALELYRSKYGGYPLHDVPPNENRNINMGFLVDNYLSEFIPSFDYYDSKDVNGNTVKFVNLGNLIGVGLDFRSDYGLKYVNAENLDDEYSDEFTCGNVSIYDMPYFFYVAAYDSSGESFDFFINLIWNGELFKLGEDGFFYCLKTLM